MSFWGDERSQSVVIGAVLLFGFLVIAMSTYQVTVVPDQNEEIEFGHEQAVRQDMLKLRNSIVTTGTTGESDPTDIKLGARFPSRTLFVNPPPATGSLRTVQPERRNVTVNVSDGATFVGQPVSDEALDYWSNSSVNYTTKFLVYEPNYREFSAGNDGISIENSHVFADYENGGRVNVTTQSGLLQDDRVTIVLVRGNLTENGIDSVTVDPSAISTIRNRERVNGWVNVTVPTTLSPAEVRGLLNPPESVDLYVEANGTNAVDVRVNGTVSLGIAAVGVGSDDGTDREPAYIDVEEIDPGQNVQETQIVTVTVEVRDQFGNPLSGVRVNASVEGSDPFVNDVRNTSDAGTAVFQFNASKADTGLNQLNFSYAYSRSELTTTAYDEDSPENATVNVSVTPGPDIDPGTGTGEGDSGQWPVNLDSPDALVENSDIGFENCDSGVCTVDAWNVSRLTLRVSTDGQTNGATVSFSANNTSVASVSPTVTTTDSDGNATTTLTINGNGNVSVVASSGGGTAVVNIRVINYSGVVYNGDAVTVREDDSGVEFSVTNNRSTDVTVTGIRIDPADTVVSRLDDPTVETGKFKSEFHVETPGGPYTTDFANGRALPTVFDLSEAENVNEEHLIRAGETATYTLYQFLRAGGDAINMTGQQFEVELFFSDGSRKKFVVEPESTPGVEYQYDAVATTAPGGSVESGVRFNVTNNRTSSVTVEEIRLDPASGTVARLADSDPNSGTPFTSEIVVEIDGSTSIYDDQQQFFDDEGIELPGTFDLSAFDISSGDHTIPSGETATYTLYAFRDALDSQLNMSQRPVEVELFFTDGTSTTFTVNATSTAGGDTSFAADDPGFAYEDTDNDGEWDPGTDVQLSDSDVKDGSYDAASNGHSLVIPPSVGSISASSVSFKGQNLWIGVDVTSSGSTTLLATTGTLHVADRTIDSNGGGQELLLSGATIDGTGATITSAGKVTVTSTSSTDLSDATVTSEGPGQELKITGGPVTARNAAITSQGKVTITPSGAVDLDGTTVDSLGPGQELKITGTTVRGVGATLDSAGKITVTASSGELRFSSAVLDVEDGSNQPITLKSNGDMYLDDADLIGDEFSTFSGDRNDFRNTLYVDGAEFYYNDFLGQEPKSFDISPEGPGRPVQNQDGNPDTGTVD
jgi:hypothetical protein